MNPESKTKNFRGSYHMAFEGYSVAINIMREKGLSFIILSLCLPFLGTPF